MPEPSTKDDTGAVDEPTTDASAEAMGSEAPEVDDEIRRELEGEDVADAVWKTIARLQAERDEAVAARQRWQADFVNFRRRAQENEVRALRTGTDDVVRSLIPVLDHMELAVAHGIPYENEDEIPAEIVAQVEQLLAGVRMVQQELMKALEAHGVHVIKPEVGAEFDPNQHQAVMREPGTDLPPNAIVRVLQIGYAVEEHVLRPACVSVSGAE